MFCSECGANNDNSSNFCLECGKPLKNSNKILKKEARQDNKKKKYALMLLGGIVILLGSIYLYIGSSLSPSKAALKYFEATINNDTDKLYNYLDMDHSSKLTTKKVFKELMKNNNEVLKDNKVTNYKVVKTVKSVDGMYANVTINYATKNSNSAHEKTITLAKEKKKKYLFFDNWKIRLTSVAVIEDYKIKVMANSEVSIAGVRLTNKDLNKSKSTKKMDVYNVPSLFNTKYPVKITFPQGFTINTTINPSAYVDIETIKIDASKISAKTKKDIINKISNNLKFIYDSSISNKDFTAIKSNFEHKNSDLKDLEKSYTTFNNIMNKRSKKLIEINVNDIEIKNIDITDEGYLEVYFRYDYLYKTKYNDEEDEDESYSYTYMIFDYEKEFKLNNFKSLNYNFY